MDNNQARRKFLPLVQDLKGGVYPLYDEALIDHTQSKTSTKRHDANTCSCHTFHEPHES